MAKTIPESEKTPVRTNDAHVSVCPHNEIFPLPEERDFKEEFDRLKDIVNRQKKMGREIVVVMGVGFVGAVMAGVVADAVDRQSGKSNKFVIGMQRPSTRSYWKIPYLNRGIAPVEAEDPEVAPMIERCVTEKKTLIATFIVIGSDRRVQRRQRVGDHDHRRICWIERYPLQRDFRPHRVGPTARRRGRRATSGSGLCSTGCAGRARSICGKPEVGLYAKGSGRFLPGCAGC